MNERDELGSRSTKFDGHGTSVPSQIGTESREDSPRADHTPSATVAEAGKLLDAEMSQAVVAGDPGSHATSLGIGRVSHFRGHVQGEPSASGFPIYRPRPVREIALALLAAAGAP